MIQPPYLSIGDTIGIMSPSSYVDEADIISGAEVLKKHGFNVIIHPQATARHNQSAGTHEQKAEALHELVKNPDVKAIFFAGGGNRALHLLDYLDFDLIRTHPKIYMGFSDNTVLLNAITARTGIITYHGPVVKRLVSNNELEFNLRLLKGEETIIPLSGAQILNTGNAQGWLIGGNLSAFRRLLGTTEMPDATGAILFLEETYEELSRIDAELCFLKRSGLLDKISGLIFGEFNNLQDTGRPFGFSLEDIIAEHTTGLKIPVITNAPFGHGEKLYALPIGQKVKLDGTTLLL
jgi:muramoyltetrapeptide carboxypeptidase